MNVIFAGQPDAGNTMAAEVIAADPGVDLLKIDLSQISKYVGETDKRLRELQTMAASVDQEERGRHG